MNDKPQGQPNIGNADPATQGDLTLDKAADAIGVDSFTMLSLIQRGKVNPTRSRSGEIVLPEVELAKLAKKGR